MGVLQKNWLWLCGQLPKILTLFMTKICDIPHHIYDLTKNWISYEWPDRHHVSGVASSKKKRELKHGVQNWYPIYYQIGGKIVEIDTLFMTKMAEKPFLYSPDKGSPHKTRKLTSCIHLGFSWRTRCNQWRKSSILTMLPPLFARTTKQRKIIKRN